MDNVTHALAGLLLADAAVALIERRTGTPAAPGLRRTAVAIGVITAELPDADLLYSGGALGIGKLGYLLHHRGHTHTVIVAVLLAAVVWGVAWRWQRAARTPAVRGPLLALALGGVLSHLLLDYTNSYGVHPFWPLENGWFYGDAMFIVEPWLWVAAIPALLFGARSKLGRGLLGLALVVILGASWLIDLVDRSAAVALLMGSVLMLLAMRRATTGQRLLSAAALWMAVEAIGISASAGARAQVVAQVAPPGSTAATLGTLQDVVLTPKPANPLCFDALVVEADGETYRVGSATVAPWPSLVSATACAGGDSALAATRRAGPGLAGGMQPASRTDATSVVWRQEWTAPIDGLAALAGENCAALAALRFMRVPVWERRPDRTVALSDLRYGNGGDGFADVELPDPPTTCPRFVPPWTPPRAALLGSVVTP